MSYGRAASRSAAATGDSIHGVVVRHHPRCSPGMVEQGNKQMNELSRSSKGETEKAPPNLSGMRRMDRLRA
ncbi:MAG TPA: hypothetical protein VGQ12_11050, partial [Candidatus Angelobacter sp.]|nr:hypothetical protein [Candidatus Angelobacter sp.]